jgi:hypothetical protein
MSIRAFAAAALTLAFFAIALVDARPRPDDPVAPLLLTPYESAYKDYRPFREEPVVDWRTVNDEVRDTGGHMGHIRDEEGVRQQAPVPAAGPPVPKPPAAGGQKHAH